MVVEAEYYDGPCKLLEVPPDVMSLLFSYLDATALYQLSQTCSTLKDFVLDPFFWRHIDARDEPNCNEKLWYCTQRINPRTVHVLLRGTLSFNNLPPDFFKTVECFKNLKVLALENVKIRGSTVTLKDFPSGLEELSLRKSYVNRSDYFFQQSVKNMTKLKVLILDECSWVTCSFLLSVSKYEHLEIISIVKCLRVHVNMMPYLNVAKLGCKKLRIFDCRFTAIGGEVLRTFFSKDIQRLYFQSVKSAEIDYEENVVNWVNGRKLEAISDAGDPAFSDLNIQDGNFFEYQWTYAKPKNEIEKITDSFLYKDPYPKCTCGGESARENAKNIQIPDNDVVHIPSGKGEPKFVCNRHMKDIVHLPKHFRDFFLLQHQQFHPASDHLDSDSNSDEEDDGDGCCYFGMGTSLIVPSTTHDRTPSVGEEMSLPVEGASARAGGPTVYVYNPSAGRRETDRRERELERDGVKVERPHGTPKTHGEAKRFVERVKAAKRRFENGDFDNSDTEPTSSKKAKKAPASSSSLDGVSSEVQEILINQLMESADDVSARIEKIMEANGLTHQDLERRRSRMSLDEPSTSSDRNGAGPSPSPSNTSDEQPGYSGNSPSDNDKPSFSGSSSTSNNGSANDRERSPNNNNNRIPGWERLVRERDIREAENMPRVELWHFLNRNKTKREIPLKRLSLRGYTKISDETLDQIKNLDVELIDLTYTMVTKEGIENFLVYNPNCRVIHPFYCICKPHYSFF